MTPTLFGFRFDGVVALSQNNSEIHRSQTHSHHHGFRLSGLAVYCLLFSLCLLTQGCRKPEPSPAVDGNSVRTPDQILRRGVAWLIQNQAEDGGWRSTTYGTMRSGVGTTAIALEALSECPLDAHPDLQLSLKRGLQYLTTKTDSFGMVCAPDGRSDSPVYATALVITAGTRAGLLDEEKKQQLVEALQRAQQVPANGWPQDAIGRGGWGVEPDPATAESNPATISVTVFALNALAIANGLTPDSRTEALNFLKNCRSSNGRPDGGFWFVPRPDDHLNKAGWFTNDAGQIQPRSYHTATCDGIISLNRLGIGPQHAESQLAIAALLKQATPSVPVQLKSTDDEAAPLAGLFFYNAMTFSSACAVMNDKQFAPRLSLIHQQLVELQRPDGSWESPLSLMREDDPLIATSLALLALSRDKPTQ
ncbi:prenyltransferase/squalene oxidase repeat-containing protein [Planctomicrobium sp. SH527]|uniref:prenyltransferase/squalene oxidase repeat-containing protein n=1 Tax=Planctomicrobium sp. SH527 TaxID=3448123 RepID=UPI003F5BAC07